MKLRLPVTPLSAACLAAGMALTAGAHAERADRAKAIVIEADGGTLAENQSTGTLFGNVVITQGSMQLRADRMDVRRGLDESIFASASGGPNGRASFRQRRDVPGEWIEGEAELIVFDSRAETVKLQRRAQMRRLVQGALADEVSGDTILRDGRSDRFTVEGANAAAKGGVATGASTGSNGRLRIMITPPSALPTEGAAQPGEPAARLKPSTEVKP